MRYIGEEAPPGSPLESPDRGSPQRGDEAAPESLRLCILGTP